MRFPEIILFELLPVLSLYTRLCIKGVMVAIVTSAKYTRPSVARAAFTRVTSPPCRSSYTRRFVSKLVENAALCVSAQFSASSQVSGGMKILLVKVSGMKISPVEAGDMNLFARYSGRYEHFARLRRRGVIGYIPKRNSNLLRIMTCGGL